MTTSTASFENLTPHAIVVVTETGTRTLPPSGAVARCSEAREPAGSHDGLPLAYVCYAPDASVPPPRPGTLYIVSAMVRAAYPDRTDLASPGALVRDGAGQVIGCRELVVNQPATASTP